MMDSSQQFNRCPTCGCLSPADSVQRSCGHQFAATLYRAPLDPTRRIHPTLSFAPGTRSRSLSIPIGIALGAITVIVLYFGFTLFQIMRGIHPLIEATACLCR